MVQLSFIPPGAASGCESKSGSPIMSITLPTWQEMRDTRTGRAVHTKSCLQVGGPHTHTAERQEMFVALSGRSRHSTRQLGLLGDLAAQASASSNALASCRSAVSKPSVNQP